MLLMTKTNNIEILKLPLDHILSSKPYSGLRMICIHSSIMGSEVNDEAIVGTVHSSIDGAAVADGHRCKCGATLAPFIQSIRTVLMPRCKVLNIIPLLLLHFEKSWAMNSQE